MSTTVVNPQLRFSMTGSTLVYEGSLEDSVLKEWLQRSPKLQQLVSAPVLVSTIDYLMPATEGGRRRQADCAYAAPAYLRFGVGRTGRFRSGKIFRRCAVWPIGPGCWVHGCCCHSATLPPSLVQALFAAYCAGRKAYNHTCGEPGLELPVSCAWFE